MRWGGRLLGTALASASAVFACAGPTPEPEGAPVPSWLQQAPDGCAVGFSGPTLNPGDAIRYARRAALSRLAAADARARVHVESELLVGSEGTRGGEFTRQDIEGSVRNSRIVALWAEKTADPSSATRVRHVYAMACHPDAVVAGLPTPSFPDWLLNVPERPGEVCAIGVGGPTWDPRDQEPATLRDAQKALAEALESRLHQVIIDTGEHNPHVASALETSETATARAEAASKLEESWSDDEGAGPLGLKGVLYGLACISST